MDTEESPMREPPLRDGFYPDQYLRLYSNFQEYNERLVRVGTSLLEEDPDLCMDLGCGVGLSTVPLTLSFPDARIIGCDPSASMLDAARRLNDSENIRFLELGAEEAIEDFSSETIDLIFVKSAFHHFPEEVGVPELGALLSPRGSLVIMERTARSARSFPLCNPAREAWASFFSEDRQHRFLTIGENSGVDFSTSSFGEYVSIPANSYFSALRARQLSFLWPFRQSFIDGWAKRALQNVDDKVEVFEEYRIYIYTGLGEKLQEPSND